MDINQDSLLGVEGLLIFEINDQEYCSDMKYVTAILNLSEILNTPKAPKTEIHLNDEIYGFINISRVINCSGVSVQDDARIILFEMFQKKFGFLVNKVTELLATENIFINKSLDFVLTTSEKYIKGFIYYENRKIILMDFEKITRDLDNLLSVNILDYLYNNGFNYKNH